MTFNYLKKAKKVSHLYPPVVFPKDKNDWTIGHQYLKSCESERKKIYIPTLVGAIYQNKLLKLFSEEKSTMQIVVALVALRFFQKTKFLDDKNKDKMSFLKRLFFIAKLRVRDVGVLGQRFLLTCLFECKKNQVRINRFILGWFFKGHKDSWDDLIIARNRYMPLEKLVFEKRLANCGELSNLAMLFLFEKKVENHRCQLLFNYKGLTSDTDHSIVLFRTDNKQMSFEEFVSDLYHPSVRILDVWNGKCCHPKEMLNDYLQIFNDQKDDCVSRFKPGTALLLKNDYGYKRFFLGSVNLKESFKIGHQPKLVFSPVCVPHQYQKRACNLNERG